MLNQVLVSKLPKSALARFTPKIKAKNKAAIGPVPGKIPENTPRPKPKAILCGVSLILKSLRYINLLNLKKLLPFILIFFILEDAFKNFSGSIFGQAHPEFDVFGYFISG